MWLTNLAPEIQKAILFSPRVVSGADAIEEIDVLRIVREMDWEVQRGIWKQFGEFVSTTSIHVSVAGV